MSTLAEILEMDETVGNIAERVAQLEERAAEIMRTRREAFEERNRLRQELHRADGRDARNVAIIAALKNDVAAAADELADRIAEIEARADDPANGARYAHYRLERLADVTLDLVGGVVEEIALQEIEAEEHPTPGDSST